jgi:hypothetical protein
MIDSLDLNTRRDQTRRMIAKLLNQRMYVLFAREIGLQCHGRLGGLMAVGLSALIKESMPHEYVGPMPAIAIVDDGLRDGTCSQWLAVQLFDSMVLHELAHVVELGITAQLCPRDDKENLHELVQTPWTEWAAHSGTVRWFGHDLRYIRALLHLHHRMESRGHRVCLPLAFCHESYGLSSITEYADALGDEPQRTSWLTLTEAMAGPMPKDFQKLWTADVLRSLTPALERANNDC